MTGVWMGHSTVEREVGAKRMELLGDKSLARSMEAWLGLSPFAKEASRVG